MRRIAAVAGLVVFVLVVLGVAQLVLPGIAAQRLRDRLSHSGRVLSVQVSAFPAIELLWHRADKVVIRMAGYRQSAPSKLGSTLDQVSDVGTLDASAQEFVDGLLVLHDASLTKRGEQLNASATVSEANLRSVLPILDSVTPVASSGGQLTLRGTATLFGLSATADATVGATDGALYVTPDLPLLPQIKLFSNDDIAVEGVSATSAPGGFTVHATAIVH
jgi:hypothetical protein